MKLVFSSIAALALAGTGTVATASTPHRHKGQAPAARATVTMSQARAVALQARPGQITAAELENEAGGSGLRYSFDITSGGKTFEIGVDAKTGAVLENQAEGTNPD